MSHKFLVAVFIIFNIYIVKSDVLDLCTNGDNHILCKNFIPPEGFTKCTQEHMKLNDTIKQDIVNHINDIRNKVASGTYMINETKEILPPSASMTKIIWDDSLTTAAENKLYYCSYHDLPEENRKFGNFVAKALYPKLYDSNDYNFNTALDDLFSLELKEFAVKHFSNYSANDTYDAGTILVHDATLFIGCAIGLNCFQGYLTCQQAVCYFAPSEKKGFNKLYTNGTPCTECPFLSQGYECEDKEYTNLCNRPIYNILDDKMQEYDLDETFWNPIDPEEDSNNEDGGFGGDFPGGPFQPGDTDESNSTTERSDDAGGGSGTEKNLANLFLISLYFCINILGKF